MIITNKNLLGPFLDLLFLIPNPNALLKIRSFLSFKYKLLQINIIVHVIVSILEIDHLNFK